ncbi:MAG: SIMPL domain-containing protein [Pseudomonadota bacterium]
MHFFKNTTFAFAVSTPLFLAASAGVFANEPLPRTISVTGTGVESVAPDMALISIGVVREAKTARAAVDENNKEMTAILSALKEQGIEDKDLQTSNFNIQPRYHYPKRQANGEQPAPQITGYIVSNNLDVRIRDLAKTGEILDLLVSTGMNSGGNIRFLNQDTLAILKKARISAVKDARGKAETLAEAAGVELGDILNISENTTTPRPGPIAHARTLAIQEDASAVPIAGGENSYRVNVQISWEIDE